MKNSTFVIIEKTVYLISGTVLTALTYEHVIDNGLALIIAGGLSTLGLGLNLGPVTVGTTTPAESPK
jgi:hypothetical protein